MTLPRFNLANRVTLGRFVLAFACFVALALIRRPDTIAWRTEAAWIALALFIITTATDALDGYLARRDDSVTAFGRIADPFVDKVVVCGCMVFLCATPETEDLLMPWMVTLILAREFLVTGIRGFMESRGVAFPARMSGKIKMVFQSLAVCALIPMIAFTAPPGWLDVTARVLVWITLIATFASGAGYVLRAARHLGPTEI